MDQTKAIVEAYFEALSGRNLDGVTALIAEDVDWYVPGDTSLAPWLGRRSSRAEIKGFYELLWAATEPISVNVERFIIQDNFAVISGEFSSRMLRTNKIVTSLFYIDITIQNGFISRYRLLEDSNAVVEALTQ